MYKQCKNGTFKLSARLLAWVLLTCTTNLAPWPGLIPYSGSAARASAFSLASIFPRKTETIRKSDTDTGIAKHDDALRKEQMHEIEGSLVVQSNGFRLPTVEQANIFGTSTSTQDKIDLNNNNNNNNNRLTQQESVHLQLNQMGGSTITRTATDEIHNGKAKEELTNGPSVSSPSKVTRVRVHTFVDPNTKKTWVSLNTSRRKFLAFLEYNNVSLPVGPEGKKSISTVTLSLPDKNNNNNLNRIDGANLQNVSPSKYENDADDAECTVRNNWRELWRERQLLTDRTELLAVYDSDKTQGTSPASPHGKSLKRGGFRDLLSLYTNRLVAILRDEEQDEREPLDERYRSSSLVRNRYGEMLPDGTISHQTDHRILIKWLEDNYGMSETLMLQARRFRTLPVPAQLELMNHFLEWFRSNFPYYYDRCDACGASQKDELAAQSQEAEHAEASEDEDDDHEEDDDNATFLGYIYPSEDELKGKASRTELYQCHKCGSFTKFPRYNSAFDIIQSRRGRCGEYSLLLYRFLRALNHDARWVVDWADHVWAEVLLKDSSSSERWVHLDPCEAAVDKPLLYEGWGKKQTYIIALYAPLRYQAMQLQNKNQRFTRSIDSLFGGSLWANDVAKANLVEDVTQQYTTESWEEICKRREESSEEVESAIKLAIKDLQNMLLI